MNLPCDQPLKENVLLNAQTFKQLLLDLKEKNFSGFVIVTSSTPNGFEEGVLIFKNSLLAAANYSFLKFNVDWPGDPAIEPFLNAGMSAHLIADVFLLQPPQVDLLLSFNPASKVSPHIQKVFFKRANQLPFKSFNDSFSLQARQSAGIKAEVNRSDLMAKFGFEGLEH